MSWGHVFGALGLAVGAGIITALSARQKERDELDREEWLLREKRAYDAGVLAEKRRYDEHLRAEQYLRDEAKRDEERNFKANNAEEALADKYESGRAYWGARVGDGQFYLFTPAGCPVDAPLAAEVIEVRDDGLVVEAFATQYFISFEGTRFAVPEEEDETEEQESPPAP